MDTLKDSVNNAKSCHSKRSLQCRRFHRVRANGFNRESAILFLLSPIFLRHKIKDGGFIVAIRLTSFRPPKIRLHCRLLKALHSAIYRRKNFLREYFLAADRGDVHIIKGHKNLIAFISLLLIQK